ncbi:MAG: response regulator [Candidatus Synoicihabitans palmerolidicus]|nr:response regulator [Candidatus Synoicihabitans palmerolidicus]
MDSAAPRGEPSPPVRATPSRSLLGLKRKLLVVDDEEGLLATLVTALTRAGHDAMGATDGETALKLFREHASDLDLVIWCFPRCGRMEVFTAIKEMKPEVRVLIMSGHLEPKLENAVGRSGADGFIKSRFRGRRSYAGSTTSGMKSANPTVRGREG